MIGIKYNNEFLDLANNQDSELECNSPLFLIDNVLAEYSTPITIVYSDKNVRLIGPIFFNPTIRTRQKLDVELYKDNSYRCAATLVIESAGIRRIARNSSASGYLLTGISSFFSVLKDVLCQKMDLGSDSKPYTTSVPYDGSDGFWQWFQSSWTGNLDFVIAPVRNDNLLNDTDSPSVWMNQLQRRNTGGANDFYILIYPVYPFIFIRAAFERIFKSVGWTLDSAAMDDSWRKLTVFSVNPVEVIEWPTNNPPVTMTLKYADMLPKNTKASSFILAICKRYGWVPICDAERRTCTLISLRDGDAGEVKDWTAYADPDMDPDFSADDQIYAFKNNYTGNDAAVSDNDISSLQQNIIVASKFALPTPSATYDSQAIFCTRENAWYRIDLDENNNRIWVPAKDNIFNDEPDNNNASVETDCTTLAMTWFKYATENAVDYYGLFPYCSQPKNADAGIRTLFYHGMVNEVKADGTPGIAQYPYLSATRQAPDGTNLTDWSNVFVQKDAAGNDAGIEKYWYAKWLSYMQYAEVKTQNFNLPLTELVNFKWNDRILVNNIPHLVISYIEKLSQKAFIQAKLKRMISNYQQTIITAAKVWVHFAWENIIGQPDIYKDGSVFATDVESGDMILYCYADAAGTIPFTPTNLVIKYRRKVTVNGSLYYPPQDPAYFQISLSAQRSQFHFDDQMGHDLREYRIITSSPEEIDVIDWEILEDAAYNIIP